VRFIYLSKTSEPDFKNLSTTFKFFKDFLNGKRTRFNIRVDGKRKPIAEDKFCAGEDIFFVRIDDIRKGKVFVVAYCKAKSDLTSQSDPDYPIYFEIDPNYLKIFYTGIDIKLFNSFVYKNKVAGVNKGNYFTSFIANGKTQGPTSWRYFEKDDAEKIMNWFIGLVFQKYTIFK
jgi:hypothetical protein